MNLSYRYICLLQCLVSYYNIKEEDFIEMLKIRENKYLLLLFLKKYKCMNEEEVLKILNLKNKRSLCYNIKKAEEKLLVNRDFRATFFDIEDYLLK